MAYVRRLVPSDCRTIVNLARKFHAESPVHGPHVFDGDQLNTLLRAAINDPNYLPAACLDDGQIVGMMLLFHMPMFFGPASEVGDLAFYVVPGRRGTRAAQLMLDYGEKWAVATGASVIRMGVTTGINNDAACSFFRKNGHREIGTLMEKRLPQSNVVAIKPEPQLPFTIPGPVPGPTAA
jgi:GNAT superfamily N-acetyltransferase